jgi:hypothetical protein
MPDDRPRCECSPPTGPRCTAIATWIIETPEHVALRYTCDVHRAEIAAEVTIAHVVTAIGG